MDPLVSTQWLADHLGDPDLLVVDATYFALDPARDAMAEYEAAHIPGAAFMDLANVKDADNSVPFMLPPAEKFARHMEALGIGDGMRVVVYDNTGYRTAARAWWMLRLHGANEVAILDGGLPKWVAEDRPLAGGREATSHRHFTVRKDASGVRDLAAMRANVVSGAEQVLDARSAARFTGAEADPRGLASGHIPGSRNLPYGRLFEADGTFRNRAELAATFDEAGIDLDRPLVTTCGSGVTAAILLFAAHLVGKQDVALYDGSWSEWGAHPDTPKATGA